MATTTLPLTIRTTVERYRDALERDGIPVTGTHVFGSYARGSARERSDIDVCIVSPLFGQNDVLEMQMLLRKALDVDTRIEPYPLSPEEYSTGMSPIVKEIQKYGVEV